VYKHTQSDKNGPRPEFFGVKTKGQNS